MEGIDIEKIKMNRIRIMRLNIFNAMTARENELFISYKKCNDKNLKPIARKLFMEEILSHEGSRRIENDFIYIKDSDGNLTKEYRTDSQIALFESGMTRDVCTKDIEECPFVKEIVFLTCKQYEMLNQVIQDGLMIDGRKYILYSSSTNQMKNAAITLLELEFYQSHILKLMGGLTIEQINENGGINPGKLIAYKSLPMSSSVLLSDYNISIDNILIVPDFSTTLSEKVNYIDVETWKQETRVENIDTQHWDGSGMFLPGTLPCSCQIRSSGGWVKGCVFPFDYIKFINEKGGNPVVTDVYGGICDVIRENIKLVLTKSQVKSCNYYKSMKDFREKFKENSIEICINKLSPEPHKNGLIHLPYQMEQSIPRKNFTEEALIRLCSRSVNLLNGAMKNKESLFTLMDISEDDDGMNYFYKSLALAFDKLILDIHTQKKIKSFIDKEKREASGGKVLIEGYYSYIMPDIYALCEILFLNKKNPDGIIPGNHVYNAEYSNKGYEEVCCARSPHLSDCENAIRELIFNEECKYWYGDTFDTVVSCHDLILTSLQADVDGDELLITPDKAFIDLLDREEIPLYYKMRKAEPQLIDNNVIYNTLVSSFENSIIGDISNTITKIFNTDDEPDIELIRILTAYNNFIIDFPKTQYKPELLPEHKKAFEDYCNAVKFPCFFRGANGKKISLCENPNNSNVNRIFDYIRKAVNTVRIEDLVNDTEQFNPQLLIDVSVKVDRTAPVYSKLFELRDSIKHENRMLEKFIKENWNIADKKEKYNKKDLQKYLNHAKIMNVMNGYSDIEAAAYLTDVEYYDDINSTQVKDVLWNVFGEVIYTNIHNNIGTSHPLPKRRNKYVSSKEKEDKILQLKEQYEKKADEKHEIVSIFYDEWNWINSFKYRGNCKTDRELLYLLLVFFKKYNHKGWLYISTYRHGITRNLFDSIIGSKISDKGINRLADKGAIILDKRKKIWKIKLQAPEEISSDIFAEYKNSPSAKNNPLIEVYKKEGKYVIRKCEICDIEFMAEKNEKTCCKNHSRLLELKNKNKNVS